MPHITRVGVEKCQKSVTCYLKSSLQKMFIFWYFKNNKSNCIWQWTQRSSCEIPLRVNACFYISEKWQVRILTSFMDDPITALFAILNVIGQHGRYILSQLVAHTKHVLMCFQTIWQSKHGFCKQKQMTRERILSMRGLALRIQLLELKLLLYCMLGI